MRIENLEQGELKINVRQGNQQIILSFSGRSDSPAPGQFLNPYFNKVVEEIDQELVLEFMDIKFINSPTMPPLMFFFLNLERKGIKTTLYYDKDSRWQTATFKAFKIKSIKMKHFSVMEK